MRRRATERHTGRAHPDPPQGGRSLALHVHEALFYRSQQEYLDGLREFIAPALTAGEPVAVAVPKAKFGLAREALDGAENCELLDMEELGRNPGRIIPAVERMLHRHHGHTLHYVGEPIWPGRSSAEIREAVRHEALINVAWPGAEVRVLCPYDVRGLDKEVLRSAEQTHPTLVSGGEVSDSPRYRTAPPRECELPLPSPPVEAAKLEFGREDLARVRTLAAEQGKQAGLRRERVDDLVIVTNELASNALQHGWPPRRVAVWPEPKKIVCEVTNRGAIDDPLAGRRNPSADGDVGMGLWIVHHLCELVEVRTGESTTVRAHLATG
jgi:anti-sigma regulatory factor (Ser/Thr protein kinase)